MAAPRPLEPNDVIGILGGGQLGRMLSLAAASLGLRTHVFCPDDNCPASQVTSRFTKAAYTDETALAAFAKRRRCRHLRVRKRTGGGRRHT